MRNELKSIFDKYKAIGGYVLILKNGIECYPFGYASLEKKQLTKKDTIYRIASISKVVVATAVMVLYDRGLIDIKEDISNYLGYFVRNPHYPNVPITIEMLMTQTSSICDGEDEKLGYDGVNGPKFYVNLKSLLTDPSYEYYSDKTFLKVEPGTTFCYSNFGCGILACIVEHVTNTYFCDFVRENVLIPLGVDASFRIEDINNVEDVATLYDESESGFYPLRTKEKFFEVMFPKYPLGDNFRGPAGGLFISPMNLSKFMSMLMNEGIYENTRIIKKDTVKFMKEVHWQTDKPVGSYKMKGLQLLILDIKGRRFYGHTGSAYGLRSFMFFNNNEGYIFMCNGANYENGDGDFTKLQEEILNFIIK